MLFPPDQPEDAVFLSRSNPDELLGCFSPYAFELEGKSWPTVEHYYQGMKFTDDEYQEKIRQAATPKLARSLGRKKSRKLRADWKKVREVVMTRAIYIRCKTYPHIADALLATGSRMLIESNNYDYFWGCGRDKRGQNAFGKVLMKVRNKLQEEAKAEG
ncbi:GTP cyclohydrolase [Hahella sp. CCB-MM4]|uniref:NADAR family protein n=1 Tax=Hahella sp. (strain CCB-MM4) TaxID=1926491 RepID=UPI000B9BD83E|nr:NADAR family protein [Hahella sp. CCB-MM4]OZG71879.1 GTP cyclohydrolase [Hahella sp. CCB-MM4]